MKRLYILLALLIALMCIGEVSHAQGGEET